jgi:hypothetical protein
MNVSRKARKIMCHTNALAKQSLQNLDALARSVKCDIAKMFKQSAVLFFNLHVYGIASIPEDDPIYGYYEKAASSSFYCQALSPESAIAQVNAAIAEVKNEYCAFNDGVEFCAFAIETINVTDQFGRIYATASVNNGTGDINWVLPLENEAIAKAVEQSKNLYSESSFESGWDNFSTARSLAQDAFKLSSLAEMSKNIQQLVKVGYLYQYKAC